MTEGFEVIPPRLFAPEVGVDAHVTSRPGQGFSFPVGNVLFGLWVSVLLGHAEIDHVDDICGFGVWSADEEIVGFDVAVDEVFFVDGLDAGDL